MWKRMYWPVQVVMLGAGLALLMTWVLPLVPTMPHASLDASWGLGLNYAVEHNWIFGRDIIFTFGPLSSIYTHFYSPGTYELALALSLVLGASLLFGLLFLFVEAPLLSVPLIVAMLFSNPQRDALFLWYPLLFYCVLRAAVERDSSHGWPIAALVLSLAPSLGILCVVKGTLAVGTAAFIILCALYLILVGRSVLLSAICMTATLSFLLAWVSTGQPLGGAADFLQQLVPIIGGYTEAMATWGPKRHVILYGAASLAVLATIFWAHNQRGSRVPVMLLDLAAFGLFLFLCLKAGMVRHDAHAMISAAALFLVVVMMLGHLREFTSRQPGWVLGVGVAAMAAGYLIQSDYIGLKLTKTLRQAGVGAVKTYVTAARNLLMGKSNREAYAQALNTISKEYPLLPVVGTADLYSFDQAQLIASGMQWNPRPIFQSYSAYTPSLIEANMAHLVGAEAPQNIIITVQTIDGRYPSLDDGAGWPLISSRYRLMEYDGTFAYLARREDPSADATPVVVGSEQHVLGVEFEVPSKEGRVFAVIRIRPTLLGRLLELAFKTAQLHMMVKLNNGEVRSYRTVSRMMQNEFLLSPVVDSTEDFMLYVTGNDDRMADKRVTRMKIDSELAWLPLWQDQFEIQYSIRPSVEEPLPDSIFAAQTTASPEGSPRRCTGSLDLVNNKPSASAGLSPFGPTLKLTGWIANVEGSSGLPPNVLVGIDFADGTRKVYKARRTPRGDVARALDDPGMLNVGFNALVELQSARAIDRLNILAASSDGVTTCDNLTVRLKP